MDSNRKNYSVNQQKRESNYKSRNQNKSIASNIRYAKLGIIIAVIGLVLAVSFKILDWFVINKQQNIETIRVNNVTTMRTLPRFSDSNKFCVLIIPFMQHGESGLYPAGKYIYDRLNYLSKTDSLYLTLLYPEITISERFNSDSAEFILKQSKAHMVIYGTYQANKYDSNRVVINYVIDPLLLVDDSLKKKVEDIKYSPANLNDLKNGALQGKIDFIIYSITALIELRQFKFSKAIDRVFFIKNKYKTNSDMLQQILAFSYLMTNRFDESIKICTDNLYDNKSSIYYYYRSICYLHKDQLDKAMNDIDSAIIINPQYAEFYNVKSVILSSYISMEYLGEAIYYASIAIKMEPKNDVLHSMRSKLYYTAKEYDSAYIDINNAIKLYNKDSEYYNTLGLILSRKKMYIESISNFKKAISLNPDYYDAYYNCSLLYLNLERYDESVNLYSKMIKKYPKKAILYLLRGRGYQQTDRYNSALSDYTYYLQNSNDNISEVYNNIANCYLGLKEYEKAIDICNNALKIEPVYSDLFLTKGSALYLMGFKDKACEEYSKAMFLGNKEAYDYINKMCLSLKIKE